MKREFTQGQEVYSTNENCYESFVFLIYIDSEYCYVINNCFEWPIESKTYKMKIKELSSKPVN